MMFIFTDMIGEQYMNYSPILLGTAQGIQILLLGVIIIMLVKQHKKLIRLEKQVEKLIV